MPVALWSVSDVTDAKPERLAQQHSFLEKNLEGWVEADAQMVAEGLTWVARQPYLADGTKPDLLGLTREGTLVVAELKQGPINLATLTQALRYVLVLESMTPEAVCGMIGGDEARETLRAAYESNGTPDFSIMLIGTGHAPEVDRGSKFLSDRGLNVPITIVTFTPFLNQAGGIFLARDVEESVPPETATGEGPTVERVRQLARDLGCIKEMDLFIKTAADLGLGIKPWATSLTIVPPSLINRTLLYLKPTSQGTVRFDYGEENLLQRYNLDPSRLATLGPRWVELPAEQVVTRLIAFAELMREAFTGLDANTNSTSGLGTQPMPTLGASRGALGEASDSS